MSNAITRSPGQQSLLNAPAGGNAGIALDNGGAASNHSVVAVTTAGITAGTVQLQGSHDNINWVNVGSPLPLSASSTQSASITGAPFQFVRAVAAGVTGGTVSAWIASAH